MARTKTQPAKPAKPAKSSPSDGQLDLAEQVAPKVGRAAAQKRSGGKAAQAEKSSQPAKRPSSKAGLVEPAEQTAPEGARNALLRRSVLDAAARLFADRGYGSTNLQDIADALGMRRPSLYYYFSSKEKLLEALLEEVTYAIERQSTQIADQADLEPEEALRLVIRIHALWLLEHGTEFRVIDRSDSELSDALRDRHQISKRRILDNVTKIIARGVQSSRFRSVDPQVAAFAVIGMCSWTAWWFKPDGRLTADMVADTIAGMAARSVIGADAHLQAGDDPLAAVRILREDLAYLEQLMRR